MMASRSIFTAGSNPDTILVGRNDQAFNMEVEEGRLPEVHYDQEQDEG